MPSVMPRQSPCTPAFQSKPSFSTRKLSAVLSEGCVTSRAPPNSPLAIVPCELYASPSSPRSLNTPLPQPTVKLALPGTFPIRAPVPTSLVSTPYSEPRVLKPLYRSLSTCWYWPLESSCTSQPAKKRSCVLQLPRLRTPTASPGRNGTSPSRSSSTWPKIPQSGFWL